MEPYHGTIWNPFLSQVIHERSCWPCTPIPQGVRAGHSGRTILLEIEDDMLNMSWKKGDLRKCEVFIERWLICCCESCESHWRCQRLPGGLLRQNTFLCRNWSKSLMKRKKDSLVITVVGCGRLLIASRTLWGASSVRQWKHFSSSRLHLRVVAAFYTPVGWWTVWGL